MREISIRHTRRQPTERTLSAQRAALLLIPGEWRESAWQEIPFGPLIRDRLERLPEPMKTGDVARFDLPGERGTRLVAAAFGAAQSPHERLTLARKAVAEMRACNPARVPLMVLVNDAEIAMAAADAAVSALLAACAELPSYRTRPRPAAALRAITLHGLPRRLDTNRLLAEAQGNELARRLTMEPGNRLTPKAYRQEIATLARRYGWRMRFIGQRQLERHGAGAFLAVTRGSDNTDAGIAHLVYEPPKHVRRTVALVGKGLCFDTGGVNLKTARTMQHMHEDMAGSAVALGTLAALTQLQAPLRIECWLALAHNAVGPRAYQPNDVVKAANGTTIEVVHTDAEGRMVLADTLALASRRKPALIIDYATLTGSCIYALGSRYSGAFTNRDNLMAPLTAAGRASGERIWPFPNDRDYDELLESDIADVLQCTLDGEADHILAARFLQRFIDKATPWVHLDLGAARHRNGLAHVPTDVTGFGVRLSLELLLGNHLREVL